MLHSTESQRDYESSLIERICTGTRDGESGFLFIQSPDLHSLHTRLDPILRTYTEGFDFHGCSLTKQNHSPFFPFLDWISTTIPVANLQDAKRDIYALHKPIFSSYLQNGTARRYDELLPFERVFEKQLLLKEIIQLIARLNTDAPLCLYLRGAQHLPSSSVRLLTELLQKTPGRLLVVCSFAPIPPDTYAPRLKNWQELIQASEKQGLLLNYHTPTPSEQGLKNSYPVTYAPKTSLTTIRNAFTFQAFADCIGEVDRIQGFLEEHPDGLNSSEAMEISQKQGLSLYYLEETEQAITALHRYLALAQQRGDQDHIAKAYRCIAQAYLGKDNIQAARSMAEHALGIARGLNDQHEMFYAHFIEYLVEGRLRTMPAPAFRTMFYSLIDQAHRLKLENAEAFISVNPYNLYGDYSNRERRVHQSGMRIARRLGNTLLLAAAYQLQGLAHSVQGDYRRVITSYKKSLKLKQELQSDLELSYIHNGLGFYYFMTGEYSKAQRTFAQALQHLRDEKDYHEIAMTLFNMGENAFMCGEYQFSQNCLEQCLDLLHSIERDNLAFHSRFCILSLFGLACIQSGKTAQAWQVLITIESQNLEPFSGKNEELCYFRFLLAKLNASANEEKAAIESFAATQELVQTSSENIDYLAPILQLETACDLRHFGHTEAAKKQFDTFSETVYEQRNAFFLPLIKDLRSDENSGLTGFNHRTTYTDIAWVSGVARTQRHLRSLHRRMDEIHFINLLQSVRHLTIDRSEFIHNCIDILHSNLGISGALFFSAQPPHGLELMYSKGFAISSQSKYRLTKKMLAGIDHDRLILPGSHLALPDELSAHWAYISPIILHDPSRTLLTGYLLLTGDEHSLNLAQEQRRIFSIARSIIEDSLLALHQRDRILEQNHELKEKNRQLTTLSQTDFLTELFNRSTLYPRIYHEIQRIIRYGQSGGRSLLVLFIDLDNFKYYNDTFGHSIGDELIKIAADILKASCRETDSAYRFGGDEFIILMPQATVEGGTRLAHRIIHSIESSPVFEQTVRDHIGTQPDVPEERRLSCSIGISSSNMVTMPGSGKQSEELADRLLQMADEAVYTAKKQGKGMAVVYKPGQMQKET